MVTAINNAGAITGYYTSASGVERGFVRSKTGHVTIFSAPGAGASDGQGTFPNAINSSGVVTGFYADTNYVDHGFLRKP